ncbi:uncharacterized protein N0V89_009903 [Didymosphaeria variabile]|uniref:Uncharacterized protein n=1 Tax=Didymosphaeria variabile TaxID=1932322 RepID=A0A9W8XE79_9PLEO|nr:uncharacterized protein N0V89_009903 [Didymosphaeria variabile]KAJ4348526.1 hypothetical protein N0V89_009903 [Didymosphaeria variabile]
MSTFPSSTNKSTSSDSSLYLSVMEVVGVVASVATLVAVAKEVSELTIKLTNSLCDAPRQFAQLKNHTCLVFLALQSLDDICVNASLQDLLSDEEIWIFNQALTTAKHEIMAVKKECTKICVDLSASRRRLRWSLMQKSKAEECLQQLQRVENSLAIILQSTNL